MSKNTQNFGAGVFTGKEPLAVFSSAAAYGGLLLRYEIEEELMYPNERLGEILEILKDTRYASVEYLAAKLHISPSSIRRDLSSLERQGLVLRSYGGAELVVSDHLNIPFAARMLDSAAEKKKMAVKAASLVNDGDVVIVDGSTSGLYLVRQLVEKRGLTVVTTGVEALHYLSAFPVKTISTGGTINPENRSVLVGDEAIRTLASLRANFAFFSSQALDESGTLFDNYQEEIPCIRRMLDSAACRVFLCDGSKVGRLSTFRLGTLADLDILVSDKPLDALYREAFPKLRFL